MKVAWYLRLIAAGAISFAAALAVACVEKGDTNVSEGGNGGAGQGGTGGTTNGGAGGASGGSAGAGGGQCLGDSGGAVDCDTLPYAATTCDGGVPQGVETCKAAKANLRPGVVASLFECLSTATQNPCSGEHVTGVTQCVDQSLPNACTNPESATICLGCSPVCQAYVNALTAAARTKFKTCHGDLVTAGSGCDQAFNQCTEI